MLSGLLLSLAADITLAVEEAEYAVVVKQDELEIREYAPSIVAEVLVDGGFEDASNMAFRTLFNYISGNNTAPRPSATRAPGAKNPI